MWIHKLIHRSISYKERTEEAKVKLCGQVSLCDLQNTLLSAQRCSSKISESHCSVFSFIFFWPWNLSSPPLINYQSFGLLHGRQHLASRLNRWGNYSAFINPVPSKGLHCVTVALGYTREEPDCFLLDVGYFMVNSHCTIQEKHASLWNYVIQIFLPLMKSFVTK